MRQSTRFRFLLLGLGLTTTAPTYAVPSFSSGDSSPEELFTTLVIFFSFFGGIPLLISLLVRWVLQSSLISPLAEFFDVLLATFCTWIGALIGFGTLLLLLPSDLGVLKLILYAVLSLASVVGAAVVQVREHQEAGKRHAK